MLTRDSSKKRWTLKKASRAAGSAGSHRRASRPAIFLVTIILISGLISAIALWVLGHDDAESDTPGSDRLRGWSALNWMVKYDGYGEVSIEGDSASLKPQPVQDAGQTSAALALAGDSEWSDYSFTAQMMLQQQLRQNSPPNTWETGWLFFRYQGEGRSYYLAHKTNGLELGKLVPPVGTGQAFLATEPNFPAELGRWYDYRIDVEGPTISVYVDGELRITYTDSEDPILSGGVGLYTEDAHVYFRRPEVDFFR